jgi:hypothetical protein
MKSLTASMHLSAPNPTLLVGALVRIPKSSSCLSELVQIAIAGVSRCLGALVLPTGRSSCLVLGLDRVSCVDIQIVPLLERTCADSHEWSVHARELLCGYIVQLLE